MDILGDENKQDKVNAVLPSTQASQPGSSTGGETQPYPSPREVDLHEIGNRAAATLSIRQPAAQNDRGEERDLSDRKILPACQTLSWPPPSG